jgi:hypothetical protein
MFRVLHHTCVSLFLLIVLAGCVSVDSRVWDESVDREATVTVSTKFSNHASYRSTGEFLAIDNLAELLNVPALDAETVLVSLQKEGGLTLTFFKGATATASKTYRTQDGLSVASDGKIELPKNSSFVGGGGAIGYQSKTVTLFVNKQGDLVTIQSGGGAGTVGIIIPIGIYAKHLAIFPQQK